MKKISLVTACYNEAKNIQTLYDRVIAVMHGLPQYDYELIFVDNASTDSSAQHYHALTQQDSHVHAIFIARNTGNSQASFLAGMHYATGDAIILFDGDLQEPPEVIPQLIERWEAGYDVVYGVRKKRKESAPRRICYFIFYRIFKMLSYLDIPLDAGDFGLMSKRVVQVIKQLPEKDLYLRGLRAWAGFKQTSLAYERDARFAGVTSNSFFGNIYWVKKAIVNFSYKPLEFISRLAFGSACITSLLALFYLYRHFTVGSPNGFLTLLMFMFIFSTLQLLALAVLAEYIARIFHEVKGRPAFIISHVMHQPERPRVSIQNSNERNNHATTG
jgi:glycosyltransferase involved in cell wall biosynthesis